MTALVGAGDVALDVGVRLVAGSLVALVAALVLGWSSLIPVSLVLVGAAYATHLSVDDAALDAKAPFFAAGLLLAAELGYWSLEERERVRSDPSDALRRLALLVVLALGALLVSGTLLALVDAVRAGGLAVDLLSAAAAAAVLLVIVLGARRTRDA